MSKIFPMDMMLEIDIYNLGLIIEFYCCVLSDSSCLFFFLLNNLNFTKYSGVACDETVKSW